MDYNKVLEIVLNGMLGGGCLVGLLNWWRGRKSKERGVSPVEHVAVSQAAQPPIPLGTPDWEALTRYWQKELHDLRAEYRKHLERCQRDQRSLERHIDELETYIWRMTGNAPPPRIEQGEIKE